MNTNNSILNYGLYTGLFSVTSELTGHLFMDNVKMEKQRTNYSYNRILENYFTLRGFWNGFYPWVGIQSLGKGIIVGATTKYLQPQLSFSNNTNNLILGFSTGIAESLLMTPLVILRTQNNKRLTEKWDLNEQLLILLLS